MSSAPAANPPQTGGRELLAALATQHARLNSALEATPEHEWRNQYHADLSPIGWHYAHCHFIESVWLRERVRGESPRATRDWHDLYFPELSPKWRRGGRLPPRDAMLDWGRRCQEHHQGWLQHDPVIKAHRLLADDYLTGFLAQHHAMHLETLEQVRWFARLRRPSTADRGILRPAAQPAAQWVTCRGGPQTVGTREITAFDNEQGVHETDLPAFAIRRHPVANAEYAVFVEGGGYRNPGLWDPAGREWLAQSGCSAPLGWQRTPDGGWQQTLPGGTVALDPDAPVVGVSWHEACAFARWAGARLPHEHEWEHAMRGGQLAGTGQVWEWCANTFHPYPGFRAYPYENYSVPWFDGQHYVLRGGSIWTDPLLQRPGIRNFFTPDKRHVFAGLRLACSIDR